MSAHITLRSNAAKSSSSAGVTGAVHVEQSTTPSHPYSKACKLISRNQSVWLEMSGKGMLVPPALLCLALSTLALIRTSGCQVLMQPRTATSSNGRHNEVSSALASLQRLETAETKFRMNLTAETATKRDGDDPTLCPVAITLFYSNHGQRFALA